MAAAGADLAGEARLVDAMLPRRARVLDAGCGTGRVGAALADRNHRVVGVDADPVLIEAAIEDHPGCRWLVADLATFRWDGEPFHAAVLAGNVLPFLAPGTEVPVLRNLAAVLAPDGFLVAGFGTDRGYSVADFDRHVAEAGLRVEHRFATWDLRAWAPRSPWSVSVVRPASLADQSGADQPP